MLDTGPDDAARSIKVLGRNDHDNVGIQVVATFDGDVRLVGVMGTLSGVGWIIHSKDQGNGMGWRGDGRYDACHGCGDGDADPGATWYNPFNGGRHLSIAWGDGDRDHQSKRVRKRAVMLDDRNKGDTDRHVAVSSVQSEGYEDQRTGYRSVGWVECCRGRSERLDPQGKNHV